MADNDDALTPPPGGFYSDPGPAGPEEAEQRSLERIADALEGLRGKLAEIRKLLTRLASSFGR